MGNAFLDSILASSGAAMTYIRMTMPAFNMLGGLVFGLATFEDVAVNKRGQYVVPSKGRGRKALHPKVLLAMSLFMLGRRSLDYDLVASLFNVSVGVVCTAAKAVWTSVFETLQNGGYLRWPDANERNQIAEDMQEVWDSYGAPPDAPYRRAIITLDGTYTALERGPGPDVARRTYYHYKAGLAINATVAVALDRSLVFRGVWTNFYGSADSTAFHLTDLGLFPRRFGIGPGPDEHCMIADSAYSGIPNVFVPETQVRMDPIRRARNQVERAIGLLKCRWRSVQRGSWSLAEYGVLCQGTAVLLHNFLCAIGDGFESKDDMRQAVEDDARSFGDFLAAFEREQQ
eukprot:c11377_g1_i1.p1 GENE.c11377_g1_i1~~c11377_g1_i1.p1  ORF type:complete len:344 (-),score=46.96 c11377_g1_i1:8-1039(-)